jgi:hypothetical protein
MSMMGSLVKERVLWIGSGKGRATNYTIKEEKNYVWHGRPSLWMLFV